MNITEQEYKICLAALSQIPIERKLFPEKVARQTAKGIQSKSWQHEVDRIDGFEDQLSANIGKNADFTTLAWENDIVGYARLVMSKRRSPVNYGVFSPSISQSRVSALVATLHGQTRTAGLINQAPAPLRPIINHHIIFSVLFGLGVRSLALRLHRQTSLDSDYCDRVITVGTLAVYRYSNMSGMQANSDIVAGWIWLASLQKRTCPKCLAMNGSFHALDEPFESHDECRCVAAPKTKPLIDIIGVHGSQPERIIDENAGWLWFDKLPEPDQVYIVGAENIERVRKLKSEGDPNPLRTIFC